MGRLDDPQTEGRLLLFLADFLTVLLLTAGNALAFLSGYSVKTDLGAVLFFCSFAAAVSTALHSLARPWWSAAAAAGIAGLFWLKWEDASLVLWQLGQKMGVTLSVYMTWSSRQEEALLPVLLLLCAALAWILGWMAVRVRRWYLAALMSVALVLPAIQMGVLPMWGAMLAVFAGWGSMLLTSLYGRRDPGALGKARLLSLAGMCALVMALVMALPMEGYLRPDWATNARTSMIQGVNRQLSRFFDMDTLGGGILADLGLDLSVPEEAGGSGGIAGDGAGGTSAAGAFGGGASWRREDLLSLGPRRYQQQRVMTVETDDPDAPGRTVYLLGGTLNAYTGESWEYDNAAALMQPPGSLTEPSYFPAMTAPEAADCTMTIRFANLYGAWYYPYRFLCQSREEGYADESGRLSDVPVLAPEDLPPSQAEGLPSWSRTYEISYRPGGPADGYEPLSGMWMEAEWTYRHQDPSFEAIYLDVPDELRAYLAPLAEEISRKPAVLDPEIPGQFLESIAAAARTASMLSELAVYDLEAPAMEPGEDFVEHFLETGRGYCVHFATAGVMLLRMQGVPARYAAGYVARLNSQGYSRVLDSDAHAWVEIYLEGYGWYPVEMTPGYGGGDSGVELSGEPEENLPDELPEDEPDQLPEDEEPAPGDAEDLPEDGVPGGEAGEDPDGEGTATRVAIPWKALGRTALVLAALAGVYALGLLARQRARTGEDTNRSVINAYRRYQRMLRLGGVEDETMEELARKAKFSQHVLTVEEREAAWQRLDGMSGAARERQKKWERWLLPVLKPWL